MLTGKIHTTGWPDDGVRSCCGGQIYLVGGAVRDQLLGLPVTERDWVVTGSTPEQMQRAGFRPADPDFPVFLHPVTGEEYALARRETHTMAGYRGFALDISPHITLQQDLARRDLTINAIAQDITGQLIDPHQGQRDLLSRHLRHVTLAFTEDPVRVLRTARFAARFGQLGFTVVPETQHLMHQMVAADDYELTSERIRYEIQQALRCAQPWHFFALLAQVGIRPVADIPEALQTEALAALRRICARTTDPDIRFVAYVLHCPQLDKSWHSILARRTKHLLARARSAWSQLIRWSDNTVTPAHVWSFLQRLRAWHTDGHYAAVMLVLQAHSPDEPLLVQIQMAQAAAAAQVQSGRLRAQGLQGTALGQALCAGRQSAIAAAWRD